MARDFSKRFYRSRAWQQCRDTYVVHVNGLCEQCLSADKLTPGDELHHRIMLTPKNIDDPEITLNWDNLIFLCHDCHMAAHSSPSTTIGTFFTENGDLTEKFKV